MPQAFLGFYPTQPDVPSLELPAACVQSITGGRAWSFAEHNVLEGKIRREYVGAEVQPLRIVLELHAELGIHPAAVRSALTAYGDAGQVLEVSASSGRLYGFYALESCTEAERAEEIDELVPLSMRLTVTLVDTGDEEDFAYVTPPTPIALERNVDEGSVVSEPKRLEPSGAFAAVTPEEIARR